MMKAKPISRNKTKKTYLNSVFAKLRKEATSIFMSVRLSVYVHLPIGMEQIFSHWAEVYES